VQEASKNAGPPIWDVVETYLKDVKTLKPVKLNNPKLLGMDGNPGIV
jgi:S-sulfosulfanyl-L-cysteine sulfohydrolase